MQTKQSSDGTTTWTPAATTWLKIVDPVKWEIEIRRALKKCGNNISFAAIELGMSTRQMFRILQDPRFDDVERVQPGPERRPRE